MPAPNQLRQTHTYAELPVSAAVYEEVKAKLLAAGYDHCIQDDGGVEMIDMNQLALSREKGNG